jgi:hypothetical protein
VPGNGKNGKGHCFEKWALEDILKIHTTASKPFELMRFAAPSASLTFLPGQREAVENPSHSLVAELVHGPIAETIALVQEPSESADSGERLRGREGAQVALAQQPRPSDRRTFWRIF